MSVDCKFSPGNINSCQITRKKKEQQTAQNDDDIESAKKKKRPLRSREVNLQAKVSETMHIHERLIIILYIISERKLIDVKT